MTKDAPKSAPPQNKLTRRQYLQYATAGMAAVAVAGLGYYATRSTSNQTQPSLTRTGASFLTLSAPAVDFEYKPSYIKS